MTIFILSINTLSFSGPLIDRLPVMNLLNKPTQCHRKRLFFTCTAKPGSKDSDQTVHQEW